MTTFNRTLLASCLALTAAGVNAAAFQLAEVSSSGLGMAYAGNAAVADNASVVASNPALMTQFKQTEISVGGILVDGDVNIDGQLDRSGTNASYKNIVPNAIIPNAYVVKPLNDRVAFGGGVNVNYGLKSEFHPSYVAGFLGGRTSLSAVNVNLSTAYDLGHGVVFGAGVNAVHAKAELARYAGGLAAAAKRAASALQPALSGLQQLEAGIAQAEQAGQSSVVSALSQQKTAVLAQINSQLRAAGFNHAAVTSVADLQGLIEGANRLDSTQTLHKLQGDKWGFGWNVGLVYNINENHRLGVAYHSAIDLKFKGKYSNNITIPLPSINTLTGGVEIDGNLNLELPAFWEISGYHKLTDKLSAQYSYKRTDWSSFQKLEAYGASGNTLFGKNENFNDSQRIALGFAYELNDRLTLRTGIAYDESASVSHPSISIPDTDRTWYSVGATVRVTPALSADIGYSHLRGSKITFNEDGLASFTSRSKANLYGLNLNYRF